MLRMKVERKWEGVHSYRTCAYRCVQRGGLDPLPQRAVAAPWCDSWLSSQSPVQSRLHCLHDLHPRLETAALSPPASDIGGGSVCMVKSL